MSDTNPTTPEQTPAPTAPTVSATRPKVTLANKADNLKGACEALREQVRAACGRSDQPGYHQGEKWLIEAERALRKAAVQIEEADLAALEAPKGEV